MFIELSDKIQKITKKETNPTDDATLTIASSSLFAPSTSSIVPLRHDRGTHSEATAKGRVAQNGSVQALPTRCFKAEIAHFDGLSELCL